MSIPSRSSRHIVALLAVLVAACTGNPDQVPDSGSDGDAITPPDGDLADDAMTDDIMTDDVMTDDGTELDPLALYTQGHEFFNGTGKIALRGVGHMHDHDDLSGWWSGPGETWTAVGRWETDTARLTERIDANLRAIKTWGGNSLRVFMAVNWWWEDRINPHLRFGEGPDQEMSYRDYFELLAERAEREGVYVIFCPYQLRSEMDGGGGGIPVEGGVDEVGTAVLDQITTGDPTYLEPMRRFWESVSQRLGQHPGIIFEIWNEPDSTEPAVKTAWFTHQIEMYKTIRETSDNVVLLAWRMGAVPTWQEELSWVPSLHQQLRDALGQEPLNVAYDFHAYRHSWNHPWGTDYTTVMTQLTSDTWLPQTRSATVDVPVVCAETGMFLVTPDPDDEHGWWDALLRSLGELDVGYVGYYWTDGRVQETGLFEDWPVDQPAPSPSVAGQIYLDNVP